MNGIENAIFKRMWRLKQKMDARSTFTEAEAEFWNDNLDFIKKYYNQNLKIWQEQKPILMVQSASLS